MQLTSEAFRRAQLRSERTRVVGFVLGLSALGAIVVARTLIAGAPEERDLLPPVLLVVGSLLAYEGVLLAAVNRHLAAERDLPRWVWTVNLAVEVAAPTVALFLLTGTHVLGPYR